MTGFTFLSRLTQIAPPYTRFVFLGAGIRLGLPSHPASRRRSYLRLGVSITSSSRGLHPQAIAHAGRTQERRLRRSARRALALAAPRGTGAPPRHRRSCQLKSLAGHHKPPATGVIISVGPRRDMHPPPAPSSGRAGCGWSGCAGARGPGPARRPAAGRHTGRGKCQAYDLLGAVVMGQCLVVRTKVAVPCVTLADASRQPHLAHDSNRQAGGTVPHHDRIYGSRLRDRQDKGTGVSVRPL